MSRGLLRWIDRIPKWLTYPFIGLGALLLLLILWGAGIEPRLFEERREEVAIPHLPTGWEGQQIALIADLQVGMWMGNNDTIRRIVARLIEQRPAAVLIAGDFIYHPLEDEPEELKKEHDPEAFRTGALDELRRTTAMLRPLPEAGIPTYAVLGNHDYAVKVKGTRPLRWLADRVAESLEQVGITVVRNQSVKMNSPSEASEAVSLQLVGIDSNFAHEDHVQTAFGKLPASAPRLVLMHNPISFGEVTAGAAPLAMAGHSHGGQIRLPFLPNWSWTSLVRDHPIYSDGWIPDFGQPGNRLYVNRGIGFSSVPVRINCRPEVTYFTLRRANAPAR